MHGVYKMGLDEKWHLTKVKIIQIEDSRDSHMAVNSYESELGTI